ncbi:MAG: hypothetical protein ACU83U_10925 [Gammaproteobacteria bacterium]
MSKPLTEAYADNAALLTYILLAGRDYFEASGALSRPEYAGIHEAQLATIRMLHQRFRASIKDGHSAHYTAKNARRGRLDGNDSRCAIARIINRRTI